MWWIARVSPAVLFVKANQFVARTQLYEADELYSSTQDQIHPSCRNVEAITNEDIKDEERVALWRLLFQLAVPFHQLALLRKENTTCFLYTDRNAELSEFS